MIKQDDAPAFMTRWLQLDELTHALPRPVGEYRFVITRKWAFDWAWPDKGYLIAVEVDGGQFAFQGGHHARDDDRDKQNEAVALGWRVFHFSPQQLTDKPEYCVRLVVKLLERTVPNYISEDPT